MSKRARRKALRDARLATQARAKARELHRHRLLMSLVVVAMAMGLKHEAYGDGIGMVLTSKSLPDATVAVIDPESGTSTGGTGSDVRIAVGDIILFRFAFAPVPDAALHGQAGYLTEYVPSGTEVVGARIIDANGVTIKPSYPGLARDGCGNNNLCNYGSAQLPDGSLAQLVADTGIFFSTDARTARIPTAEFLSTNNGIDMSSDEPLDIARINGLIGDNSAPFYAHNLWDWLQVQMFGPAGGNTPHFYGSAVAGPDTHYGFEVTDNGGLQFLGNVGPWQRMGYPGSLTGFGSGATPGPFGVTGRATTEVDPRADVTRNPGVLAAVVTGSDITPANSVAANAVRFAMGEARTGVPMYAEIALRVTAVPLDPNFVDPLLGAGGNVDCAEVFGSDLSGDMSLDSRGDNNPWALYMGSPSCVFLRNKFDLAVDEPVAIGGDLTYTLTGSNLALTSETNARACIKYDTAKLDYVTATPAPSTVSTNNCPASACGDTSALGGCLIFNNGTLDSGEDYSIAVDFTTKGGPGKDAVTTQAVYSSTQLPINQVTFAGGFTTQAVSIVTDVPVPLMELGLGYDPTLASTPANSDVTITGTLSNVGTRLYGPQDVIIHLPTGWRITNTAGAATEDISVDNARLECDSDCDTENPVFGFAGNADDVEAIGTVGDSQAVSFIVSVPNGESAGLYPIAIAVNAKVSSFGPDFETLFPDAVIVNVGQVRSVAPELTVCPGSTALSIEGTTAETGTKTIRTYFNLIERGDVTTTNGSWSVSNYTGFGTMYGGLEVRATAQAVGELESELSATCEVINQRECSDGINNDGNEDNLIDFPADPGCDSPLDNSEADAALPECSDGIDNDNDGVVDFAGDGNLDADNGCSGPNDDTEDDVTECDDNIDNDVDGLIDFDGAGTPAAADLDCDDANDATELGLAACQNYIDDDSDGFIDFVGLDFDQDGLVDITSDPGCVSAFDDDEVDDPESSDIKARLLVVFDTSGSMNWNTCAAEFTEGDGSSECPGDAIPCATCNSDTCNNTDPDDSRLAKVKSGISDVIAGYGEVEYALMRFAQREREFSCPTASAGLGSGGWQGGGDAPCGGGFNEGELLVDFSGENQSDLLAWIDGESNYPGFALEGVPTGMDHELRGSGTTPIAGSLDSALSFLNNTTATDGAVDCRPYAVVLVTDGDETCGGTPTDSAAALQAAGYPVYVIGFATSDIDITNSLNAIANSGGTDSAIVVDDSAALSSAMASIITDTILVELCNGLDDDCDDLIDEDFTNLGDTCDNGALTQCFAEGEYVCRADQLGTECDAPTIAPGTEICDGLDNNCDGVVDDGFANPCVCVPTLEICNGVDDDCDGFVDEDTAGDPLPGVGNDCGFNIGVCEPGVLACTAGVFVCEGVTDPGTEETLAECNGVDDDCDNVVDEPVVACYDPNDDGIANDTGCNLTTGLCEGLCQTGLQSCLASGDQGYPGAAECLNDIGPATEVCDGLDNDCDGQIDETFNIGADCDNGQLGQCFVSGILICDPNNPTGPAICTAFLVPPGIEYCNGLDDDCDGAIDEEVDELGDPDPLPPPIGNACGGAGTFCDSGIIICQDGEPFCSGAAEGVPEICNGLDDDCDNLIDEEPLSDLGAPCYPFPVIDGAGCVLVDGVFECVGACRAGAEICVAGGPVCDGAIGTQPEEVCNGIDDNCDGVVDEDADCPIDGDFCFEGACVSPCGDGEFPCPLDFFCRTIGDQQFCTSDPCAFLECDLTFQECDSLGGACFDPCDTTNCPTGTECNLGNCYDCFDAGFECAEDENCTVDTDTGIGSCVTDLCFFTECTAQQFCRDGTCVDITCDPDCSANETCENGTCVENLCHDVDCGTRVCDPESGSCVTDLCGNRFCPQGTACSPATGDCVGDPCLEVECPAEFECKIDFQDEAQCLAVVVPELEGDWVSPGGGGGCSTTDGSGPLGSGVVVLLSLLGLVWRRKERA